MNTRSTLLWLLPNLGLLLASLILFFGTIEIGLRVTGLQRTTPWTPQIYRANPDPLIGYELKPNLKHERAFRTRITTDSRGFRSPEPDPAKPTIAVLGDSVTFGYGVEDDETLPARLAALLPGTNVVNAGVPGYGLPQMTQAYAKKVAPLHPTTLIVVFFMQDVGRSISWVDADGFLRAPGWKPQPPACAPIDRGILRYVPGRCWLDLHSAFYKALEKLVSRRTTAGALEERRQHALRSPAADNVTEEQLRETEAELDRLTSMIPRETAKLFVLWPDYDLHEPSRKRLRDAAIARSWTVVDLYDSFGNRVETIPGDSIHPAPTYLEKGADIIVNALRASAPSPSSAPLL